MLQKMYFNRFLLILLILCPRWTTMAQSECNLPSQLVIEEMAQVSEGQSNNVRENPSRDATRLGVIPSGAVLEVLEGPTCADGLQWWRVQYGSLIGWTVEGSDGEYWLLPKAEQPVESPVVLSTTVITAENASQLQLSRTLNCDNGPDYSVLIALGLRHLALQCVLLVDNTTTDVGPRQSIYYDIGVIDIESGQQVMTLGGGWDTVYPVAFLPDGHLLWFSRETSITPIILHLSDVTTGEEINVAEIDRGFPVLYANNTRFALFYEDNGAYVLHRWDASTLTLLQEQVFEKPEALTEDVMTFAISPHGERFAINYRVRDEVSERSELAIYTSPNPQPEAIISVPFVVFNNSAYLTFSPSGNFIVGVGCRAVEIACGNPAIYWWSASDGIQVAEWDVRVDHIGRIRFSPDDKLLVMGGGFLYEVDTGELVSNIPTTATQSIFSADGTFIVTQGDPLTLVWIVAQ